jgi:hypothetical protein
VIPPNTVLVAKDPQKMAQLLAHNPDYVMAGQEWGTADVSKVFPPHVIYWPESFRRYLPLLHEGSPRMMHSGFAGIAFMGERRSPAGHRRLVVIPFAELNAYTARTDLGYSLVLPLPGALGGVESLRLSKKLWQWSGKFVPLYLKPGVADPADASHVSLEYVINNHNGAERRGFLDVYLRDDETVDVKFRDRHAISGL